MFFSLTVCPKIINLTILECKQMAGLDKDSLTNDNKSNHIGM